MQKQKSSPWAELGGWAVFLIFLYFVCGGRLPAASPIVISSARPPLPENCRYIDSYGNTECLYPAREQSSPTPTATAEPRQPPPPSGEPARLVSVVDGDTIVVEMGGTSYRVRYIGVDTPEYGHFGYHQATEVNRQLLANGPLRLERDVSETDCYGRLLRYVYAGDVIVNAELVRLGYANASTWPPDVEHSDYFVQLEREARDAGRGLWAE